MKQLVVPKKQLIGKLSLEKDKDPQEQIMIMLSINKHLWSGHLGTVNATKHSNDLIKSSAPYFLAALLSWAAISKDVL